MSNFAFNSKHYLQKHGTAMGTRMAPSYANLFLGKFERDTLLKPGGGTAIYGLYRYVPL